MSLLHPTPGQIADRFAALLVKRDKFDAANKPSDHIRHEILELQGLVPNAGFLDEKTNLYSLHLAMWPLIDTVGLSKDDNVVAAAARKLHAMNLERYALIAKIDTALGKHAGDEKL